MKRYYLFTSEQHEEVRLDFLPKTIEQLIELWNEGYTHDFICKKLKISHVEMALIVMDLDYTNRLPERENGFWGTVEQEVG